ARVPEQPVRLAAALTGPLGRTGLGRRGELTDAATALAVVDLLGDGLGVEITRRQARRAGFHPTRTAELSMDGRTIGYAGELHPDVAEQFELNGRVAVLELDLAPVVAPRPSMQMQPVSTYPHVEFDLSFEVALDAPAASLVAATTETSDLVETAAIFDDYRNERGDRAVAISYRLRANDRTLGADEIAEVRQKMIEGAAALGAKLRGGA
ncbi:MAG: phenylalanine--tRNA ligase subunit beta, partial [Acidimicrobiia bacterium]